MGEAGGGEGVGGGTDLVARMERSALRESLRSHRSPDCAALHPGYELPRMAARIKFALAELPERRYTA